MRAALKLIMFSVSIVVFMAISALISLCVKNKWRAIGIKTQLVSFFSKLGLLILSIKVSDDGTLKNKNAKLIVSNHLSYIDVMVIASRTPVAFVTSVEIKNTPFLGQLTQIAGCLFVERRNKANIQNEIGELTNGLTHGINIAIFPEATSTNGEQVLKFKRPLFHSAIASGKDVKPVCINYKSIAGMPVNRSNRDKIFWYGDMTFLSHLWEVCKSSQIKVDLLNFISIETNNSSVADKLAEETHLIISSNFAAV